MLLFVVQASQWTEEDQAIVDMLEHVKAPVILVINKIDRPAARPNYALNATFDLFVDLGATDEQADFPVIFAKALSGQAGYAPDDLEEDLRPLFDTILGQVFHRTDAF